MAIGIGIYGPKAVFTKLRKNHRKVEPVTPAISPFRRNHLSSLLKKRLLLMLPSVHLDFEYLINMFGGRSSTSGLPKVLRELR